MPSLLRQIDTSRGPAWVRFSDADHARLFDLAQRLKAQGSLTRNEVVRIAREERKWLIRSKSSKGPTDQQVEKWLKDHDRSELAVMRWLQDIDKGARQRAELNARGDVGPVDIEAYIRSASAESEGLLAAWSKILLKKSPARARHLIGLMGERLAGVGSQRVQINMHGVPGATGRGLRGDPDIFDWARRIIGDVKNVARLDYTEQLRDYAAYGRHRMGTALELFVRETTRCTRRLRQAIARREVSINHLEGAIVVRGAPRC
jgi:hypothetical protein